MSAERLGLMVVALAFLGLGAAGCTRTSDGSVEFHRPDYGTYGWFTRRAADPVEPPAMAFPPPPAAPQPVMAEPTRPSGKSSVRPRRVAAQPSLVSQPQVTADAPAQITCRHLPQPGGRVKYVCQ